MGSMNKAVEQKQVFGRVFRFHTPHNMSIDRKPDQVPIEPLKAFNQLTLTSIYNSFCFTKSTHSIKSLIQICIAAIFLQKID